jgi:hypothetical protein
MRNSLIYYLVPTKGETEMPSNPHLLKLSSQMAFFCSVCNQDKDIEQLYNPNRSIGKFILCKSCAAIGKHCSMCGEYQLFEAFPPASNSVNRGGVKAYCRPCSREYKRKHHDPIKHRARMLLTQRGVTIEEYEEMWSRQNGVCAICNHPETAHNRNGNITTLAVDHDHATGVRRGLLCSSCNLLLGQVEKDKERIQAILLYIDEHK